MSKLFGLSFSSAIFAGIITLNIFGMELQDIANDQQGLNTRITNYLQKLRERKQNAKYLIFIKGIDLEKFQNQHNNPNYIIFEYPFGDHRDYNRYLTTQEFLNINGQLPTFLPSNPFFLQEFAKFFSQQFDKIIFSENLRGFVIPPVSTLKSLINFNLTQHGKIVIPYVIFLRQRDFAQIPQGNTPEELIENIRNFTSTIDTLDENLIDGQFIGFPNKIELALTSPLPQNLVEKIDSRYEAYTRYKNDPIYRNKVDDDSFNNGIVLDPEIINKSDEEIYKYVRNKFLVPYFFELMTDVTLSKNGPLHLACEKIGKTNINWKREINNYYTIILQKPDWMRFNPHKIVSIIKILKQRGCPTNHNHEINLFSMLGRDPLSIILQWVASSGEEQDEHGNFIWNNGWNGYSK